MLSEDESWILALKKTDGSNVSSKKNFKLFPFGTILLLFSLKKKNYCLMHNNNNNNVKNKSIKLL